MAMWLCLILLAQITAREIVTFAGEYCVAYFHPLLSLWSVDEVRAGSIVATSLTIP